MFIHLLKYRLKVLLKPSQELFWNAIFPFVLGTFFYLAFGSAMETSIDFFDPINVAIVEVTEPDEILSGFLTSISSDGDSKLLNATYTSKEDAIKMLKEDKIEGIITLDQTLSLSVASEGYNQSILQSILNQYNHTIATLSDVEKKDPSKVVSSLLTLTTSKQYNEKVSLGREKNLDALTVYFYALIAMQCLFGSSYGFKVTKLSQANLSALGSRCSVAPAHKLKVILANFISCLIVHYATLLLLIFYLNNILKIDFGNQLLLVCFTSFIGSIVGICFGIFITSIIKASESIKLAIITSGSLILCFLSGLMVNTMYTLIENHVPIVNRINPATLIMDAILSLSIYDDYKKYIQNMVTLSIFAVVLCIASYLVTRRERYASI